MNWIKPSTILTGSLVELIPFETKHFAQLELLAREEKIWEFIPVDMHTTEKCFYVYSRATRNRDNGSEFPFSIFHKQLNRIIGSTRLMNIEHENRKLEIGWTWLHPDFWSTAVNPECKLLLLTFCFEELKAIRVQFKTDENNIRSRKAITRIGAQYEGIIRNDRIRENGTIRNSAYFSIIESEWTSVKQHLTALVQNKITA